MTAPDGWRSLAGPLLETAVPADWRDVEVREADAAAAPEAPAPGDGFRPNAVLTSQPFPGGLTLLSRLVLASVPSLGEHAMALTCQPWDGAGVAGRRIELLYEHREAAVHATVWLFAVDGTRTELTVSQSLETAVANAGVLAAMGEALRVRRVGAPR